MAMEKPGFTVHLGDVYWIGTPELYKSNVLGIGPKHVAWPKGTETTYMMGGNHEALNGYNGLIEQGFKYTGQKTTYAVWQTDYWRFVALDSSYNCYEIDQRRETAEMEQEFKEGIKDLEDMIKDLEEGHGTSAADFQKAFAKMQAAVSPQETDAPNPDVVVKWLREIVKLGDENDKRGIVLWTHHQPYSAWGEAYIGVAKQLNHILPEGKTVIWLFGHEHRLAFYNLMRIKSYENEEASQFTTRFNVFPRMVGNGGFPNDLGIPQPAVTGHKANLAAWDNRTYIEIPRLPMTPQAIGFNGFFKINVDGPTLNVSYITYKCIDAYTHCKDGLSQTQGDVVAAETFKVDLKSGDIKHRWNHLSKALVNVDAKVTDEWGNAEVVDAACLNKRTTMIDHLLRTNMD